MYGRTIRIVGTSMFALLFACTRPADTASKDTTTMGTAAGTLAVPTLAEVRSAIEAANQRSAAAMKAGDVPAMAANYADNAMSFMPGMPPMNGRPAIEEAARGWLANSTVNDATFGTTNVELHDDIAIETGTYRMTSTAKNAKPKTESGMYLAVWQRQADGGWKIIRDMSTPDVAPGAQTK